MADIDIEMDYENIKTIDADMGEEIKRVWVTSELVGK